MRRDRWRFSVAHTGGLDGSGGWVTIDSRGLEVKCGSLPIWHDFMSIVTALTMLQSLITIYSESCYNVRLSTKILLWCLPGYRGRSVFLNAQYFRCTHMMASCATTRVVYRIWSITKCFDSARCMERSLPHYPFIRNIFRTVRVAYRFDSFAASCTSRRTSR